MGKKVALHLEGRSKTERKAVRARLGSLRQLTVQPKTRERYTKAVNRFYRFLNERQIELPRQRANLDPLVSDFLEHIWSEGEGRSLASDTLAGLQDRDPRLKGNWSVAGACCERGQPMKFRLGHPLSANKRCKRW